MAHNIYVASSWKNVHQPKIVDILRIEGHDVYDFREHGFDWGQIDADWENWTLDQYKAALEHPLAIKGYNRDLQAMMDADTCVMTLPCGNSAHIEAGWFSSWQPPIKQLIIFVSEPTKPDLMYKLAKHIVSSYKEVVDILRK